MWFGTKVIASHKITKFQDEMQIFQQEKFGNFYFFIIAK